jgi:hypothetical protein
MHARVVCDGEWAVKYRFSASENDQFIQTSVHTLDHENLIATRDTVYRRTSELTIGIAV